MATRFCLATLYTPEIADLADLTNPSKAEYCRRWGYTFECAERSLDTTRHPSWSKILHVRNLLDDYDWVFWLDADALIMNPGVPIEDLIDEAYDLVIAKQPGPDPWGRVHLNTGSFFLRSSDWSRRMLDDLYAQTQFLDHPAWDQEGFFHLYRTRADIRERTKVEVEPRRFNAGASSYTKGDFAFHALTPLRTEAGKMELIRQVQAADAGIAVSADTGIDVPLLYFDDELTDLLEFTVPSLLRDNAATQRVGIRFVQAYDRAFADAFGWDHLNRYRLECLSEALVTATSGYVLFPTAGSHFFPGWRRRLLTSIGANDLAVATDSNGKALRDEVVVLRRNDATRAFLERCRHAYSELPVSVRSGRDAIPILLENLLVKDGGTAGVTWTRLPADIVRVGSAAGLSGFDLLHSAVYTPGAIRTEAERDALRVVRTQTRTLLDSLRKTIIETEPSHASRTGRSWIPWRRRRKGPPPDGSGPERPRA